MIEVNKTKSANHRNPTPVAAQFVAEPDDVHRRIRSVIL
mgnify:CR=1 FL=1